jgi:ABC-type multidrug transport system fused ATPase/permease subunit
MAGGGLVLFVLLFMFAGAQGVRVAMDGWCAKWAQGQLEAEYAITIYAYILCGLAVLIGGRSAFFLTISMRSSRGLHQSVLQKVLAAPVNLFFDITPSGRILNRFSGDLNKVDEQLPQQMLVFLQNVFTVIAAVIVCAASSPWVLIGIPPLTFMFVKIVGFFQKSAREVKRLDMISRSPVLQHFSETLRGLSTIRAMDATERFSEKFDDFTNENSKVFLAFWMASRWLALRVDSISALLQGLVSVLAIALKDDADPVVVGIALVWGFQLSGLLQFVVRNFSEVENTMTGVERLVVYKHVPSEAAFRIEPKPPVSWPRGNIEFRNVVARYRPGLPVVIKDISFKIEQGERVGICGRTGSGKSTVGLFLFRIIEIESGQILIDGMDTKNIGLRDLRQRIAMIPQDPVLFRMSVRQNIDPFSQYTDERIWNCLRMVCMEEAIKELPDSLAYQCSEGGANFSLGQMQLLCIARALLQEPGLVMMDEATANVDIKSDEIIQRSIRTNFAAATMLTIAHRISTIIDSHKVAVFEAGELKEFGTPHELVRRGGLFQAFVTEAQCELGPEPGAEADIDIVVSGDGSL